MTSTKRWTLLSAALSLTLAWGAGCAGSEDDGQPASASPAADDASGGSGEIVISSSRGSPPVAVRLPAKLNDAQIVGILGTANMDELQAARLATTREAPAQIRNFAELMITDHSASNQQLAVLSKQLSLAPIPSAISVQLHETAKKNQSLLQRQTSAGFDRLYIDTQVAAHANMLALINSTLLPNVESPALAEELLNFRAMEKEHLDVAIKLQSALGPPSTSSNNPNG